MTRRIGLFGGSFDPVHQGHLALARSALEALRLDELRWVPAGQPWQKRRALTPAPHRVAMLQAALAHEPRFMLECFEVDSTGPGYTIDTVRHAQLQDDSTAAQWFLLIGQDQYDNFRTWHEWQALLGLVALAVAVRDVRAAASAAAAGEGQVPCVWLPMPPVPVSATEIRQRLAAGEPASSLSPLLVAPAVASYIARHALYCQRPLHNL